MSEQNTKKFVGYSLIIVALLYFFLMYSHSSIVDLHRRNWDPEYMTGEKPEKVDLLNPFMITVLFIIVGVGFILPVDREEKSNNTEKVQNQSIENESEKK